MNLSFVAVNVENSSSENLHMLHIQGDFSKAKDNNMVLNCSPQAVCPPLNPSQNCSAGLVLQKTCQEGPRSLDFEHLCRWRTAKCGLPELTFWMKAGHQTHPPLHCPSVLGGSSKPSTPKSTRGALGVCIHQHQGVC